MFSHILNQLNSIHKRTANFFKIHFTSHSMYVFVWTLEDLVVTAYIQRLGIKIPHSAHTVYLWVLCDFKTHSDYFTRARVTSNLYEREGPYWAHMSKATLFGSVE